MVALAGVVEGAEPEGVDEVAEGIERRQCEWDVVLRIASEELLAVHAKQRSGARVDRNGDSALRRRVI
jgi:hypothetical protein